MARRKQKFDSSTEDSFDNVVRLAKKKFTLHDLYKVSPKTKSQKKFAEAFNSNIPLVVQSGAAGTGKSFMACYYALREVITEGTPYDKVIIIRSAVETRRSGFLPGEQSDKNAPFEAPYHKIFSDMSVYKDPYTHLKALGHVEFHVTNHIRGNTFDNAIIIVDEIQNCDQSEILSVLTRCGENSRLILCGDSRQDDLKRMNQTSSHSYIKKLAMHMTMDDVSFIEYGIDDIVRSGLVKKILTADHMLSL